MLDKIPIIGARYKKMVGITISDFEAYLTGKGCIIMPFTAFVSNPNMAVMVVTDVNAVKAYVDRWSAIMVIKAVYRQGMNTYFIFNSSDSIKVTIS